MGASAHSVSNLIGRCEALCLGFREKCLNYRVLGFIAYYLMRNAVCDTSISKQAFINNY